MKDDPLLSTEQQARVRTLSDTELKEIDEALLKNTDSNWRKVARVIGGAIMSIGGSYKEVPDIFYAQRVKTLVEEGLLESQGNLNRMRHSEVKRLKIEND